MCFERFVSRAVTLFLSMMNAVRVKDSSQSLSSLQGIQLTAAACSLVERKAWARCRATHTLHCPCSMLCMWI